jgi:hypothetical protein
MPLRKERNIAGDIMNPHRKKYSLEYYLKIAEQLVDHGVHTLAIKVAHAWTFRETRPMFSSGFSVLNGLLNAIL